MEGTITVSSEFGKGTAFSLIVPSWEKEPETVALDDKKSSIL